MRWIQFLWILSLLCSSLGFITPVSLKASFILGLYVLGLQNNFGKVHHYTHLPMLIMFVFFFVRNPGRFSLDYLLFRKWLAFPKKNFEHFWPLQISFILVCLNYFSAGYQKLITSGITWGLGETMEIILLSQKPITPLALSLVGVPFLAQTFGTCVFFMQLFAPALFIFSPLRHFVFFFPAFHFGSYLLMGKYGNFNTFLPVFFLFVPWTKLYNLFKVED